MTTFTITRSDTADRTMTGRKIPTTRTMKTLAGAQRAALAILRDMGNYAPSEMDQVSDGLWVASCPGGHDVYVERSQ